MSERRNPFEGVTDYFSELARMRGIGLHGGAEHGGEAAERTHASAWVPATDILAKGDDLVIRVELAGVDPEDVDLRFTHGALTVSGTRRPGPTDDGAEFLVRERYYGEFRRVDHAARRHGRRPDPGGVRGRARRDHRQQRRHARRQHQDRAGRQVRGTHDPERRPGLTAAGYWWTVTARARSASVPGSATSPRSNRTRWITPSNRLRTGR